MLISPDPLTVSWLKSLSIILSVSCPGDSTMPRGFPIFPSLLVFLFQRRGLDWERESWRYDQTLVVTCCC
jgi:hypothetical protein